MAEQQGGVRGHRLKLSALPGAIATRRYDASLARWLGVQPKAFRERTADLVGVLEGDTVLDLGCGSGDWTLALARRAGPQGQVTGVDLSKELLAGARRKAKRAGLAIAYRVASVEALPLKDASVDLVVSSLVFHHLAPPLLAAAVRELRRVLKPGGRVVVLDFQSLDQAGRGQGHGHGHGGHGHTGQGHGRGHAGHARELLPQQAQAAHPEGLHDHRASLLGLLKAAGFGDVHASPVVFGQALEVTRGSLPSAHPAVQAGG